MSESNTESNQERLQEARQYWDVEAATFDEEPDHGLRDPIILGAWTELLETLLPQKNLHVLDIGCGTGSLSMVLAGLGHRVTGVDLSPAMIDIANAKAASRGVQVEFLVMDAAFPHLPPQSFGAILCRHLLWALPEPEQVLQRWLDLLTPTGRLILIEGFWATGAGLHARDIAAMLPDSFTNVSVYELSSNPDYWGGVVTDERYALAADRQP